MLTIFGNHRAASQQCDGVSRRDFLKIGGMAAGGLSLSQVLATEAAAGTGSSHKAIINVYLPGGPSHIDMFDMKPDAASEIRGEFRPMKTNVRGIEICELFPRTARLMDKIAVIRSIVDSEGLHDCYQCMTGRRKREVAPSGGWPQLGTWISKLQGPVNAAVPANVSLMYPTGHREWGQAGKGGFLGPSHAPMDLVAKDPLARPGDMTLKGVSLERLRDRTRLLGAIDRFRRDLDNTGVMDSMDAFTQQAFSVLSSSGLVDALDVSKEDPRIVERYGQNSPAYQRDGAPKMVQNLLIARRLVEAGARVVSLNYSRWDWHGGDGLNFPRSRQEIPLLDQGLSALITDLHERGLDKDVSVVVWGEFGRTPRINKMNSRDHWPQVTFALLIGGGMRTGQVIGATDRNGDHVTDRPVTFQEVFATLYHNMGIDVTSTTVRDLQGRPMFLLDPSAQPLSELV